MKKQFYTYILLCSDDSYYVGITNNIIRRISEHNSDRYPRSYCYNRRPVQIVYTKVFDRPMPAIRFEKQLKKWSRRKKQALIQGNFEMLHELSSCKNLTSHKFYTKK